MGQVPPHYLLLGSGRLAKHLSFYFKQLGLTFSQWARQPITSFNSICPVEMTDNNLRLKLSAQESTHILLALRDDVIEEFIQKNSERFYGKTIIHFSGSLNTSLAIGLHPLMTFAEQLYPLKVYQEMYFAAPNPQIFAQHFPQLPNKVFVLPEQQKALYHALCSASGNMTVLLWQNITYELSQKLNVPQPAIQNYMDQIFKNMQNNLATALTGPLSRKDWGVIEKHQAALAASPVAEIYSGFLNLYRHRDNQKFEVRT